MERQPQTYAAPQPSENQQGQHVGGSLFTAPVPTSTLFSFVTVADLPVVVTL